MEVKEFNDLPYKERLKICYYATQQKITMMRQMVESHQEDVTPRYRKMTNKWRNSLEKFLAETRKELETLQEE